MRCKNASELVDKANGYAAQADTKMAQLTAATKNIDESSNQIGGIIKTEEGIKEISKVVQANSTAAGGSAVASQELSAQANTLNGLIRQFRIQ